MIVIDASAVVEILRHGALAERLLRELEADRVVAPHLLDIEVLSALRNLVLGGRVSAERIGDMLDLLGALPIERLSHGTLIRRIWELRANFTPYDAVYIALAEKTDSVLYTVDAKLVTGHRARVVLFRP